ncbi:MAG: ABC transporter permease [Pseudomonadota bacterium]
MTWFLRAYLLLVIGFIFLPIVVSLLFSFNSDRFPTLPFKAFTTVWYETIFSDPDFWRAARNSLVVSGCTCVLATLLGFCTAYTDYRYSFRGKSLFLAIILLPPTIPLIIIALAMLAWFSRVGMSGHIVSIIAAHTVLTAPFAMAIIRLRLSQIDESLEAAAWNLGASEWMAMRNVILPFCKPAILSSLFLTAAVSFDEFTVAWFVSGLNKTLPVHVLEIVQGTIDPQVNAIGTLVFAISITLVAVSQALIFFRLQRSANRPTAAPT